MPLLEGRAPARPRKVPLPVNLRRSPGPGGRAAARPSKLLLFCLAVFLFGESPLAAEDNLWSAVLIASNEKQPKETPPQLGLSSERLKRVLGYNQFEILGAATTTIADKVERTLSPTEHFSLTLKARRSTAKAARGGYMLDLELFHDKKQLVETEARLAPDSPLFIRGPMHARGQILIVLKVGGN